jgi:hypothetical protein
VTGICTLSRLTVPPSQPQIKSVALALCPGRTAQLHTHDSLEATLSMYTPSEVYMWTLLLVPPTSRN